MERFDSLYYTDCRQGQGLRGGAGFQFQAVSRGATHEMMSVAQRSALYEAPVAWMREKRPVSEYPPSLTHVFEDGLYVTAHGVYLGTEVDGVREGNQFTHAVSTKDEKHYGPLRPAQLWGADWWSRRPASGTECEPVPAEPEPGRGLGVEEIRDWVRGAPGGESRLIAMHSAFDRLGEADARRVVFVGADPDEIVRWITAATLLLPQELALRTGFRVYAMNAEYSRHEVIALHPDWAGSLAVTSRDCGYVVFDLESGRHTAIEPSDSALHWVPRFLRDDPYDVIDAVELAHRLAQLSGRERTSDADRLAAAVCAFDDPVRAPAEARELAAWATTAASADAVEPVVRAILAGPADVAVLRQLDRSVADRRDLPTGEVRLALLRAEIDALVRGTAAPVPETPPGRTHSPEELDRACALVEGAAGIVPPDQVDVLLRIAANFGVTPRLDRFNDAAARFVRWWADRPGASIDPQLWSCAEQVLDLLQQELSFRLQGPLASRTAQEVREHWWRLMLPLVVDPFGPLDTVVAGAAVAAGDPGRRTAIAAMGRALRTPERAGAAEAAWDALFGRAVPSTGEIAQLIAAAGPSGGLAHKALDALGQSTVDADFLEILGLLGDHLEADQLRLLRGADLALSKWLSEAEHGRTTPPIDRLDAVPESVLSARAARIAEVFLQLKLPVAANRCRRAEEALVRTLVHELSTNWGVDPGGERPVRNGSDRDGPDRDDSGREDRAVALVFLAGCCDEKSEDVRLAAEKSLRRWAAEHRKRDHVRINKLLRGEMPSRATDWQEWLRQRGTSSRRTPATQRRFFGRRRERGE